MSDKEEEEAVIGMWSAILWLITMTLLVALLSDYLVSTIQVFFLKSILCPKMLYVYGIWAKPFQLPSDFEFINVVSVFVY